MSELQSRFDAYAATVPSVVDLKVVDGRVSPDHVLSKFDAKFDILEAQKLGENVVSFVETTDEQTYEGQTEDQKKRVEHIKEEVLALPGILFGGALLACQNEELLGSEKDYALFQAARAKYEIDLIHVG